MYIWFRRELNTQPPDLESGALPLRHEILTVFNILFYVYARKNLDITWPSIYCSEEENDIVFLVRSIK